MAAAGYGDTTDPRLTALHGASEDSIEQALLAASSEIDDALAVGGYVSPVDFDELEAGDARDRLQALFRQHVGSLAAGFLTAGHTGTGRKTVKDRTLAEAWLARLRSGQVAMAIVPRSSGQNFTLASGAGPGTDPVANPFTPAMFDALRRQGETPS